jgi:hypothetical protein
VETELSLDVPALVPELDVEDGPTEEVTELLVVPPQPAKVKESDNAKARMNLLVFMKPSLKKI